MATLITQTPEGVSLRQEIAGAGSRLAAGLLDGLLLLAGYLLLLFTVWIFSQVDPSGVSDLFVGIMVGGVVLVVLAYHVLFHLFWKGMTPGKSVLGLRVTSADGYPPTALQIVLRALIWIVDLALLVPLPIGLVLIAATERHQRLGDIVAGTLVVRSGRSTTDAEPWPTERWSDLAPRTLALSPGLAARLRSEDLGFLRELITRADLDPEARRRLFVEAARHYSERLDLGAFEDARVVLKEIYLFARESLRARTVA